MGIGMFTGILTHGHMGMNLTGTFGGPHLGGGLCPPAACEVVP